MTEETYSTEGPKCPHCLVQFTADEPFYYNEDYMEDECCYCNKKFKVSVYTQTSWTCEKID